MAESFLIRAFIPNRPTPMEYREPTQALALIRLSLLNGLPGVVAELVETSDLPPRVGGG